MKALVQKEIRLLVPAYAAALVLAIVPVWLVPKDPTLAGISVIPFWFGAMMLALSAFGREFTLHTFPLILAQPSERYRIWRTKTTVLAGAMTTALAAWCLSWCLSWATRMGPEVTAAAVLETLALGGTTAIVTFAGGLWSTLLLRQVAAAFWFTILAPGAIMLAIGALGGSGVVEAAVLCLYSIFGFFAARRLFFRFQDAGWTGGVISLAGWRKEDAASKPAFRAHRPLAALFRKELQLQQFSLAAIGCLFLLHLGVVGVRRLGHDSLGNTLRAGLEVFGGLWLIVPLLVGSPSVAEERKLGASPQFLCLPVSSRLQFGLKLLFVLALGGVLSGLLLWTAEGIGTAAGGGADIEVFKRPFLEHVLVLTTLICLGLSFIGFYASTLTRSIVQALAAAIALIAGGFVAEGLAMAIASGNWPIFGVHLWQGYLVFYIAVPVLVVTFAALAYRNFRCGSEDRRLWRRNLLGLTGALLFIAISTTAAYHRAWELITPLEPRHGAGRLVGHAPAKPLQFHSFGNFALGALLPDGRLWVDRLARQPGRRILKFGDDTGFRFGAKWQNVGGNQIERGSNWVAVAADSLETVAIRADGTLWVSERPFLLRPDEQQGLSPEQAAPLVRFGLETNWQSVVQYGYGIWSVLLQKKDGTLWASYVDHALPKNAEKVGLRSFEPHRLGTDSDWERMLSTYFAVYAWKTDGRAWVLHPPNGKPRKDEVSLGPAVLADRSASLDHLKCASITDCCWPWRAAVLEDGTLWAWAMIAENQMSYVAWPPVRIGNRRDWSAVAGDDCVLAAIKTDGSLWQWRLEPGKGLGLETNAPVRLGTHSDWIGVGNVAGGTVSLAADGSLWYWWTRDLTYGYGNREQPMLAPSRRPSKIENILDGNKPALSGQ